MAIFDGAFSNEAIESRLRAQGYTEGPITAQLIDHKEVEQLRLYIDEHHLEETAVWYDRQVMYIMATNYDVLIETKLRFSVVPKSA
jgi:hypothetical protein